MAVSGGILASLCFFASFARSALRLMSRPGRPFLVASWSSIRALARSAQHRKKRSLSGASSTPFFCDVAIAVIVVVAIVSDLVCAVCALVQTTKTASEECELYRLESILMPLVDVLIRSFGRLSPRWGRFDLQPEIRLFC